MTKFLEMHHIKHETPSFKSSGLGIGHLAVTSWAMPILILSLSACSSQPTVGPPVYIPTKTYIPIPTTLTQPISVDLTGATWGKAVGDLKAGLQTCDGQLQAIKDLKVPPKTP